MNGANISPPTGELDLAELSQKRIRWLRVALWIIALGLGFAHVWADHHYLESADAMSYLDIAEAYLRGDWAEAINTYWGPLYSWLLALALLIAKPSPYWKFSVLHLVNFAIYIFTLGCFDCLIRELIRYHQQRHAQLAEANFVSLPGWAWIAIAYPLCIWSLLYLITLREESPDLLVAAFVFLASYLVLRIRRHPSNWLSFVSLGIALGFGFLAKSVMLPLSIVFLSVAFFSVGCIRKAWPRVLVAVVAFVLVGGPFILAMSRHKGRLTFGDSGRLNYLWVINEIPSIHWQGDREGLGVLKHPSRKVFDNPDIYEFGEPIGGTYPVWYDPTYWYEGSVARFNLGGQLAALGESVQGYYEIFKWGVHYGLLVTIVALYFMGRRGWLVLRDWAQEWPLIVPALSGMALYMLIAVQGRYIAPFLMLLWLALFSALRLPNTRESRRLLTCMSIILMMTVILTALGSSRRELDATARYLIVGEKLSPNEHWQIAEHLHQIGIAPGDKVAVIGNSWRAFWAHLARVRIVAEIDSNNAAQFWKASTIRNRVIETFAHTGAKIIVSDSPPPTCDMTRWIQIGNTTHYYVLATPGKGAQAPSVPGCDWSLARQTLESEATTQKSNSQDAKMD